jgi:hypothetical protein
MSSELPMSFSYRGMLEQYWKDKKLLPRFQGPLTNLLTSP